LFFLAFFWPAIGRGLIFGDAVDQLIEALPMWLGPHPFWQPLSMLGTPYSANPLSVTWYPLAALRFLPGSYDAYELAAYVIAACGAYGLARAVTRSGTGAIVAGFVYALSGFMIGHAGHIGLIHPAAWVPWVFWALVALRNDGRPPRVAAAAAAFAMLALAGQPQVMTYTLFAAAAYCAVARSPRFAASALAALALGCALAAIALVPGLELAFASTRAHVSLADHIGFADPLAGLPFRLVFPYLLGQTTGGPYAYSGFNIGSFAEMSNYVGVTTLVLATIGATARSGLRVGFWIGLFVVALALSTGNDLGLGMLTYHVPGLNWFRAPGRYAFEVALGASVLAAAGIAAIERGIAGRGRVAACWGAVAALMAVLAAIVAVFGAALAPGFGLAHLPPETVAFTRNAALWLPALLLAAAGVAVAVLVRRPRDVAARALLVAVVVVDLSSFGWFAYWNSGAFPLARLDPPAYAAALRATIEPQAQRVLSVPTEDVSAAIAPNLNVLWGIASVRGYTTLELARSTAALRVDSRATLPDVLAADDRTLDAAGVRFVVVPRSAAPAEVPAPLLTAPQRWRAVPGLGPDRIFENQHTFGRAWIVHRAESLPDAGILAAIRTRRWDPARAVLVSGPLPVLDRASPAAAESARIVSLAPAEMVVDVRCATRCALITSDAPYPGWSARIDGSPVPLFSADYAFRGVAVPAGDHRVMFAFFPWSTLAGGLITLAALGVLARIAFSHQN